MRNWAGNVTFATEMLLQPRTVEQLQDLVVSTPRLRPLGSRHSFSRIADTDGALVDVSALELEVAIEPGTSTVTVPAGIRYGALALALAERDLALHNLGSLPHISLAGACATGTHGGGVANRCLAAAVVGVEFVAADGSLVRIREDDPDLAGAVVALGALGVVIRLTLRTEPAYKMRQDVWIDAPLAVVADQLDEVLAAGYSVSAFTRFGSSGVMDAISVKSRIPGEVADGTQWGARPASSPWHPIAGGDPAAVTPQLGAPGPWHERLPHFRAAFTPSKGDEQQSEYLLPREHGPAALRALAGLTQLRPALLVCELRSVAGDDLWLSPCYGRDTVAVHFTWRTDDVAVAAAVHAVEAALDPFDPRPHWGKVFGLDGRRVRAAYPRLPDVRVLAERYDPNRRFGNHFLERYLY